MWGQACRAGHEHGSEESCQPPCRGVPHLLGVAWPQGNTPASAGPCSKSFPGAGQSHRLPCQPWQQWGLVVVPAALQFHQPGAKGAAISHMLPPFLRREMFKATLRDFIGSPAAGGQLPLEFPLQFPLQFSVWFLQCNSQSTSQFNFHCDCNSLCNSQCTSHWFPLQFPVQFPLWFPLWFRLHFPVHFSLWFLF